MFFMNINYLYHYNFLSILIEVRLNLFTILLAINSHPLDYVWYRDAVIQMFDRRLTFSIPSTIFILVSNLSSGHIPELWNANIHVFKHSDNFTKDSQF